MGNVTEDFARRHGAPAYRVRLPPGSDDACPPLWQFGGGTRAMAAAARPVILVSLEPLLDRRTYADVCRRVAAGLAATTPVATLQPEFFEPDEFPAIAPRGTPYWRTLHVFLRGWLGHTHSTDFAWSTALFSENLVEIPYSPYHAPSRGAAKLPPLETTPELDALFLRRMTQAIRAYAPRAIIALGMPPLDAIRSSFRVLEHARAPYIPRPPADLSSVGPRFYRPWHHAVVEVDGARTPVFGRRAPFTNWHLPRATEVWSLGRMLRAVADGAPWESRFELANLG